MFGFREAGELGFEPKTVVFRWHSRRNPSRTGGGEVESWPSVHSPDVSPAVVAKYPHLQTLTAAFAANGINHWHDGAVFHAANPALTKVADFALKDEYGAGAEAIALAE
jgi:hypothetical protein